MLFCRVHVKVENRSGSPRVGCPGHSWFRRRTRRTNNLTAIWRLGDFFCELNGAKSPPKENHDLISERIASNWQARVSREMRASHATRRCGCTAEKRGAAGIASRLATTHFHSSAVDNTVFAGFFVFWSHSKPSPRLEILDPPELVLCRARANNRFTTHAKEEDREPILTNALFTTAERVLVQSEPIKAKIKWSFLLREGRLH